MAHWYNLKSLSYQLHDIRGEKKTVPPCVVVVSVTSCCTVENSFRGTKGLQLCLLGGDFSFAAWLQETWTFVFSRPHTIGKEVGVEMRAEIKWLRESLCCAWSGNRWGFCSLLSDMPLEFAKFCGQQTLILAKDTFCRIMCWLFRPGQTDFWQLAWPAWLCIVYACLSQETDGYLLP